MNKLIERAASLFRGRFTQTGKDVTLFFGAAPGRIEILGNHTDYNEGFILSAAINRYTVMVGSADPYSEQVTIYSDATKSEVSFALSDRSKYESGTPQEWANYPKGVILELPPCSGFNAVILSNIPIGAGVSSSAAVELATAFFLQKAFDQSACFRGLSKLDLALACKRAENEFVGLGCGILDQFTSAMGQVGKLVFLDCRDLHAAKFIDFPPGYSFVIADSQAPHQLVDGRYNELRRDCFEAARLLGKSFLRDIGQTEFEKLKTSLPDRLRKRASHIVGENSRVLQAVQAVARGNIDELGTLMSLSHLSSRNDFQNSCPEIDALVDCSNKISGFMGGRIQGGGFGGSTINLVKSSSVEPFMQTLSCLYRQEAGRQCAMCVVIPAQGAYQGIV